MPLSCQSFQPLTSFPVRNQVRAVSSVNSGKFDCHVILRGGKSPNYDVTIAGLVNELNQNEVFQKLWLMLVMGTLTKNQKTNILLLTACVKESPLGIRVFGVMIESNIIAGRQDLGGVTEISKLEYGKSITDACISWLRPGILENLSVAVRERG